MIAQVTTAQEIAEVLNEFRPYMPRLGSKIGDFTEYAEKLARYSRFLTLDDTSHCAGFISFYQNDEVAHIGYVTLIVVKPEYRGKRYGTQLIESALASMRDAGMVRVRLTVDRSNENAKAFYLHLGFSFCEISNRFGEWMEKSL